MENLLPPEIIRCILREATAVPEAFDVIVSFSSTTEAAVGDLIQHSMHTKLSISLVSKCFHNLGEPFLFEIIHLRSQQHLRPLVDVLRVVPDTGVQRGWWCRRLVLDIPDLFRYRHSGGVSLWGLLTSCPRLIHLCCDLSYPYLSRMHVPYTWCTEFPVPLALAQTIASTQGAHLRSLHFGPQVPISIELAERLLSHLPLLETCRFQKLRFPYPFPHSSDDVSDDEDEVVIESPGFQDRVDGAEEEEYKDVQRTATWPEGRRPIRLPFLRSLECRIFPINVGQWELPALTHVMAGFDRSYLQDSPTAPLQIGLGPHVSRITHLTFRGAGDTDLWSVVGPCMVYFDFEIHGLWVESKLAVPLPYLQTIVIYKPRASSSASSLSAVLDNISENITEDKLPALRYVRLTGFKARAKGIPDQHMQFGAWGVDQRERFAAWGVELDLLPGEGD